MRSRFSAPGPAPAAKKGWLDWSWLAVGGCDLAVPARSRGLTSIHRGPSVQWPRSMVSVRRIPSVASLSTVRIPCQPLEEVKPALPQRLWVTVPKVCSVSGGERGVPDQQLTRPSGLISVTQVAPASPPLPGLGGMLWERPFFPGSLACLGPWAFPPRRPVLPALSPGCPGLQPQAHANAGVSPCRLCWGSSVRGWAGRQGEPPPGPKSST